MKFMLCIRFDRFTWCVVFIRWWHMSKWCLNVLYITHVCERSTIDECKRRYFQHSMNESIHLNSKSIETFTAIIYCRIQQCCMHMNECHSQWECIWLQCILFAGIVRYYISWITGSDQLMKLTTPIMRIDWQSVESHVCSLKPMRVNSRISNGCDVFELG
jgi:hypothetical protein